MARTAVRSWTAWISSYAPTVRARGYARRPRARPADGLRSLIVAMPTTSGLGRLPYVREEAGLLQSLLPGPVLLTAPESAPDDQAAGRPGRANAGNRYRFDNVRVAGRATIRIHTGSGRDTRTEPFQDRRDYVGDYRSDTATLRDDRGRTVDTESWGRRR
ncbi:hypothetical protein [Streptomyces sp. NPDC056544]|uniref:lamin tail domain-containing protein n=1 Tax=unclassified Streptomyces TaxID=2593676 RepID=UPI003696B26E